MGIIFVVQTVFAETFENSEIKVLAYFNKIKNKIKI